MGDDMVGALAARLRVDRTDVAFLDGVDPATVTRLHTAVVDAHDRQERALTEAFEGTITVIPRPLRGRVRKLLLGS